VNDDDNGFHAIIASGFSSRGPCTR
jgi:hypothetical protein